MKNHLETYEWDNVWWEQTSNTGAKRVLYIGDSISCGIRRAATAASGDRILFDGFGTSKALDNPFFSETLKLCIAQQEKRDAVLFNNGLHGFHLTVQEYAEGYRKMVEFLKGTVSEQIFLVLSTDAQNNPEVQKGVEERNAAVREIAGEYGLPVIDLAAEALKHRALHLPDGIHFTDEGYGKLAAFIVSEIGDKI